MNITLLGRLLTTMNVPDLKHGERFTLLILFSFADIGATKIKVSLKDLGSRVGMSRAAVINNLKKLETKGYIGIVRGGVKDGQNITNTYAINMEKLGYEYDAKGNVVSAGHLSLVQ